MKKIIMVASLLALAGCNASVEEQKFDMERVEASLPAGCELSYLGSVRIAGVETSYPSRIFVTTCDNVITTSSTNEVRIGKSTHSKTDVTVAITD